MIHKIWETKWKTGESKKIDLSEFINNAEVEAPHPFVWQQKFEKIAAKRLINLTASTGAGKSHAIMMSSIKWTAKNKSNKTIIVVPRLAIGGEFKSHDIKFANGQTKRFESLNICGDVKKTVDELVSFIKNDNQNLPAHLRTIVCCAPTLVLAFEKLKSGKNFKNIKLVIDEAHHCSTAEDVEGNFSANKIGEVFLHAIKEQTNSALLVTATHFRADRKTIIPSNYEKDFCVFEVSFDEVQETCRDYNKEIGAGYAFYEKDGCEGIGKAFNPKEKTIIFAHRGSAAGSEYKKQKYIKDCLREMKCEIIDEDKQNGTIIVKRGRKKLVIADLITQKRSKKSAKYIYQISKETKTFDVDVIFALEKFKEGCDYPPLQHCIIENIRESYGDIIQMVGRVTRDYPNKTYCRFTTIIPNRAGYKKEDLETCVQSHLNYIISSMCILDFFKPFKLRILDEKKTRSGKSNSDYLSPLSEIGDREAQLEFMKKAIKKFTFLAQDEDTGDHKKRLKVMEGVVGEIAPKVAAKTQIAEQVLLEMASILKVRKGDVDVSTLGIEYLKSVDVTDFVHEFVSVFLSPVEFRNFKSRVGNFIGEKQSMEEHVNIWRENEIKSCNQWNKFYEENQLNKKGYIKTCWRSFYMKKAEWQKEVWGNEYENKLDRPNIQENILENLILKYLKKHKKWPTSSSKDFFYTDGTPVKNIDHYLFIGQRGLEGGSSINKIVKSLHRTKQEHINYWKENNIKSSIVWFKLYKEKELICDRYDKHCWVVFNLKQSEWQKEVWGDEYQIKGDLTIEMIKNDMIKFRKEHGKWPTQHSKDFFLNDGTKGNTANASLRQGCRGLPSGSSLAKLKQEIIQENNS